MRRLILVLLVALSLGGGLVWAKILTEKRLDVVLTLDRDSPISALNYGVSATTTDSDGGLVRDIPLRVFSPLQLAAPQRLACRSCFDAVSDAVHATEGVPTPTPTVTP